jgi:hypothetical protein
MWESCHKCDLFLEAPLLHTPGSTAIVVDPRQSEPRVRCFMHNSRREARHRVKHDELKVKMNCVRSLRISMQPQSGCEHDTDLILLKTIRAPWIEPADHAEGGRNASNGGLTSWGIAPIVHRDRPQPCNRTA